MERLGDSGASRIEVVVEAMVTLPHGRKSARLTVAEDGVASPTGAGRR
ncbi:hypothetical protein ACGFZQ_30730 [Streptomyces sp. NPDC048254]